MRTHFLFFILIIALNASIIAQSVSEDFVNTNKKQSAAAENLGAAKRLVSQNTLSKESGFKSSAVETESGKTLSLNDKDRSTRFLKTRRFQDDDTKERNKFEIFTGYQGTWTRVSSDDVASSDTTFDNGFNTSAVYYFHRYVGVKGEFSGSFKSAEINTGDNFFPGYSFYNFAGGIQVKNSSKEKKVKPFAHALFGLGRLTVKESVSTGIDLTDCDEFDGCDYGGEFDRSFNGFSQIYGGGIDVKVHKKIDFRVFQFDWIPVSFNLDDTDLDIKIKRFRLSTGVVFNF